MLTEFVDHQRSDDKDDGIGDEGSGARGCRLIFNSNTDDYQPTIGSKIIFFYSAFILRVRKMGEGGV